MQQVVLGQKLGVAEVGGVSQRLGIGSLTENRNKDRVQHQHNDDDGCYNGRLVLAEAVEGVTEIADLLGFKLLIMQLGIDTDKLKLLSGNFGNIIIFHHFLLPILILGSMIP